MKPFSLLPPAVNVEIEILCEVDKVQGEPADNEHQQNGH